MCNNDASGIKLTFYIKRAGIAMARNKYIEDDVIISERKRWGFLGLPLTFTTYTLTSKKLIVNTGFFNTTENEILLYRIADMTIKSSLWQKLFGFGIGDLEVISSDKTHPKLKIKNIKNYNLFKKELSNYTEKERLRIKFRAGELLDRDVLDDDFIDD